MTIVKDWLIVNYHHKEPNLSRAAGVLDPSLLILEKGFQTNGIFTLRIEAVFNKTENWIVGSFVISYFSSVGRNKSTLSNKLLCSQLVSFIPRFFITITMTNEFDNFGAIVPMGI